MRFLADNVPQKIAIQLGEHALSFAALKAEIQLMANQLNKLPKALLILEAKPCFEFIVQLLAALSINQPVALFAPDLSEEDKQVRKTLLGRAMTVNQQGELIDFFDNSPNAHHPELALLLFTSGTTGQIKAVQLSALNIEANCMAVINALAFSQTKDQLLFLPLSYSFGLLGQLIPGLMSGISTQLITQFTDIKTLLENATIPQMWSGVPSHWVAINKMASRYPESARQIKRIVSAGAPLPVALRAELCHTFPQAIHYNNYGLTEASPRVLTYSSDDSLFMEPFAGYPIGDWQVMLSEDQELMIRGKQIMLGYLGDEHNTCIPNGWLATGDIAEILPNGLIAIKGRRDSQINIGGEKVNLAEIEQKISQMDGHKEVIVLPLEDELYGIRLLACFEITAFDPPLTEQQLTEKIQKHLFPQKLPVSVCLLPQLPRNQHGKLDRKALLANQERLKKERHHAK